MEGKPLSDEREACSVLTLTSYINTQPVMSKSRSSDWLEQCWLNTSVRKSSIKLAALKEISYSVAASAKRPLSSKSSFEYQVIFNTTLAFQRKHKNELRKDGSKTTKKASWDGHYIAHLQS